MQIPHSNSFANRAQQLRQNFGLETSSAVDSTNKPNFMQMLGRGVGEVANMQNQSVEQINALLSGEDVSPAEVFSSVQKSDMAFSLLVQIRNKFVEAYKELNAIQI